MFDDRSVNLKPYRDAFFAVALLDAATFYQYLANFVLYLPNVRSLPAAREYEKTEALIHQDQAIKLIIKKMGNRKDVVSDGMIGAVVGMACQAVSLASSNLHSLCRLSTIAYVTRYSSLEGPHGRS